jgi:hypothetical protein
VGVAFKTPKASIKFDLTEAFVPISTLRGCSSISSPSLPKEKKIVI